MRSSAIQPTTRGSAALSCTLTRTPMNSFASLLRIIAQRSLANWRLLATVIFGMVLAAALMSSVILYSDAVRGPRPQLHPSPAGTARPRPQGGQQQPARRARHLPGAPQRDPQPPPPLRRQAHRGNGPLRAHLHLLPDRPGPTRRRGGRPARPRPLPLLLRRQRPRHPRRGRPRRPLARHHRPPPSAQASRSGSAPPPPASSASAPARRSTSTPSGATTWTPSRSPSSG